MTPSGRASALPAVSALMLNAVVWGVSWWPFRYLQAHGLHPLWATALMYLVSVICVLFIWRRAWRGFGAHPMLWLLTLASGLTNVGFNWAVTVGDVVRVVLLFYLMPAWAVLLAWLLLGERPSRGSLLRLLLALVGVVIVLKTPETPWPLPHDAADALALLGGFSFALTNILLRRLHDSPSESRMLAMFGGGALTAAGVALGGWALGLIALPGLPQGATLAVALSLTLAFLGGNLALQYGAARLAAGTTALVMLSEIVFASLSSMALGASEPNLRTLVGGGLILVAGLLAARAGEGH
jgi:drug/metabolite transporter (DMT)-like permease